MGVMVKFAHAWIFCSCLMGVLAAGRGGRDLFLRRLRSQKPRARFVCRATEAWVTATTQFDWTFPGSSKNVPCILQRNCGMRFIGVQINDWDIILQ